MSAPSTPSPELAAAARRLRLAEPIHVTRPVMPNLTAYTVLLEDIWASAWLTNNGKYVQQLESRLAEFLGVPFISVVSNGMLALSIGLRGLGVISGEIITTPFTFPATVHAIQWAGAEPVFADIDPDSFTIDPDRVEQSITPRTAAILPVHVFGAPCQTAALQRIADTHGLKLLYDAAHAFGCAPDVSGLLCEGHASMLSFHATKTFSTGEGGALVTTSPELKREFDLLRNFGIADEETVLLAGTNAKMTELQAAFGIAALDGWATARVRRAALNAIYRERLAGVPGLRQPACTAGQTSNFGYFPILIEPSEFGMDRDQLHAALRIANVYTRKYFFPLCSTLEFYASKPSSASKNLPVATRIAAQVLCLPIYDSLPANNVERVCETIRALSQAV